MSDWERFWVSAFGGAVGMAAVAAFIVLFALSMGELSSDREKAERTIPQCDQFAPRSFRAGVPDKDALDDYGAVFHERGWVNVTTETFDLYSSYPDFHMTAKCLVV